MTPKDQSPRLAASNAMATIAGLAEPRLIEAAHPIAARFLYSLRLIAIHQKANRDPVPELASRLSSFQIASKALGLGQVILAVWPENIHVSRFCCCRLTHDEVTIAGMIEAACQRDRMAFDRLGQGFIRPDRMERLWDATAALVVAEFTAC